MAKPSDDLRRQRPEARPLSWAALVGPERDAFAAILQHLAEAARRVTADPQVKRPPKPSPRMPVVLDPERANQIVFLNGARGTGKTTVLLSLLAAFGNPEEYGPEKGDVRTQLDDTHRRVFWLEPLDMEPLPSGTNLLAALLARIEKVLSDIVPGRAPDASPHSKSEPVGYLAPGFGEKVSLALQRIQADVALAWDGNLLERRAHLDADTYAQEVLRVERARLGLNSKLRKVLDMIASEVLGPLGHQGPLFVLPVDDFDLNPARALELLQLLRMVAVPNLLTLCLGDLAHVEALFGLRLTGDLVGLTRAGALGDFLPYPALDIGASTAALAAAAVRKLIPPMQRVDLGFVPTYEALDLRDANGEGACLRDLLARIALALPENRAWQRRRLKNLADFLLFPGIAEPRIRKRGPQTRQMAYAYSASHLLNAPIRWLVDFRAQLAGLLVNGGGKKQSPSLLDLVAQATRTALSEDDTIQPGLRYWAKESVHLEPSGHWLLDATRLQAGRQLRRGTALDSGTHTLVVRGQAGWFVTPRSRASGREMRFLTSATVAMLILLHDLSITGGSWIAGESLTPVISTDNSWAYCVWGTATIGWPLPPWDTLWEFDAWLSSWNAAIARVSPQRRSERDADLIAFFLYVWIATTIAVLDGQPLPPHADPSVGSRHWMELAHRTVRVVTRVDRVDRMAGHWLILLPTLLTPEAGVEAKISAAFWNEGDLRNVWLENTDVIRQARAKQLAVLLRHGERSAALRLGMRATRETTAQRPIQAEEHPVNDLADGEMRPTEEQVESFTPAMSGAPQEE